MRPFEKIRVIDLSHVLAGPFAAYQMAVFGAEVIKVENPRDPDMARSQGPSRELNDRGMGTNFLSQGSNKRAITVDLKTPQGREIVRRLVEGADVLVENYKPGTLAGLGLGPDELAEINPSLIYCSISGFGQTGPRGDVRAYDHVIQALSGLMHLNGDSSSPLRVGPPIIDYATGTMAAFAISAALLQRERTGKGQRIDLAMMDVALMLMSSVITGYLWTGTEPRAPGNGHALSGNCCFPAEDGMIMVGANNCSQHARLFELLGLDDIARRNSWNERLDNAPEEKRILAERMKQRPAAEWQDLFESIGVPGGRVRPLSESLADPQLDEREVFHEHEISDRFAKNLKVPMAAFKLAHGGAQIDSPPAPLGLHTEEVLLENGYTREQIAELRAASAI